MFCINCGKELRDTAKFCPFCGNAVEQKLTSEPEKAEAAETEVQEETAPVENVPENEVQEETSPVEDVPENEVQEETAPVENVPENEVHEETAPVENVPENEVQEETVPVENVPENEVQEKTAPVEVVPKNQNTKPAFSENFDEKDGLFVMRGQDKKPVYEAPVQKKKSPVKKILSAIAAIVVIGACAYAVPTYAVPAMKYSVAVSQYKSGEYAVASGAFSALGSYKDSADYMMKCSYGEAEKLLNSGRYTEAADAFAHLDGYADSDARAAECLLAMAETYIAQGDYGTAIEIYTNAGKTELAAQTAAAQAEALAESGNYFEAAEIAKDCCDESTVSEYIYLGASAAKADGDYKTAADAFVSLDEYKDSASLAQEAQYGYCTSVYAENGASEEVARGFYFLGNFRDSSNMFKTVSYEYGKICASSGDYAAAAAMFKNAGSFRDASNELTRARYELGKSLIGPDPASARSIFALLSTYSDSAEQKKAASSRIPDDHENWYADCYVSVDGYYTTVFNKEDALTVYCTAGTDSISQPVTLTLTLRDSAGTEISADCENVRNSGTFTGSFSLVSAETGSAEIIISRKDNGAVLRTINISITE